MRRGTGAEAHELRRGAGDERPEQGGAQGDPPGGKPKQHEARDPPMVVSILPGEKQGEYHLRNEAQNTRTSVALRAPCRSPYSSYPADFGASLVGVGRAVRLGFFGADASPVRYQPGLVAARTRLLRR